MHTVKFACSAENLIALPSKLILSVLPSKFTSIHERQIQFSTVVPALCMSLIAACTLHYCTYQLLNYSTFT